MFLLNDKSWAGSSDRPDHRQRKLTQAGAAEIMGIDHRSAQDLIYAGWSVPGIFGRTPHAFPGRTSHQAKIKRRPLGSGTGSPNSIAVSSHKRIACCALPRALS